MLDSNILRACVRGSQCWRREPRRRAFDSFLLTNPWRGVGNGQPADIAQDFFGLAPNYSAARVWTDKEVCTLLMLLSGDEDFLPSATSGAPLLSRSTSWDMVSPPAISGCTAMSS